MAVTIDIVSDVVCPWCYIGATRLERVLAETGTAATVRFHPFFLDPSTPPEGRNISAWLRERYRRDPAPMFARVEAEARSGGLELDLSRQPMAYPTARAHALMAAAEPLGTQRAMARDLFATYFDQGKDITDPEVLADVGERHGLTRDQVREAVTDPARLAEVTQLAQHASAQGIGGVPFFVFGRDADDAERFALSGAQPLEVFRQAIAELTKSPAT